MTKIELVWALDV